MPDLGGMQPAERFEVQFGNDMFAYVVCVRFLTLLSCLYYSTSSGGKSGERFIIARGRFRESKVVVVAAQTNGQAETLQTV